MLRAGNTPHRCACAGGLRMTPPGDPTTAGSLTATALPRPETAPWGTSDSFSALVTSIFRGSEARLRHSEAFRLGVGSGQVASPSPRATSSAGISAAAAQPHSARATPGSHDFVLDCDSAILRGGARAPQSSGLARGGSAVLALPLPSSDQLEANARVVVHRWGRSGGGGQHRGGSMVFLGLYWAAAGRRAAVRAVAPLGRASQMAGASA